MKVVNMVKLKEEFDYESLCRKLENQVDHLTAEIDRQQKLQENDNIEMERKLKESNKSFAEEERSLVARCEVLFSPTSLMFLLIIHNSLHSKLTYFEYPAFAL